MDDLYRDRAHRLSVADGVEAQLRSQEARRQEAARLARAEAEIARLSKRVRRAKIGLRILAVTVVALLAASLVGLVKVPGIPPLLTLADGRSAENEERAGETREPAAPSAVLSRRAPRDTSSAYAARGQLTATQANEEGASANAGAERTSENSNVAILASVPASVTAAGVRAPSTRAVVAIRHLFEESFLFNLARYVKWPADAFAGPDAPFTIAVFGDDGLAENLDAMFDDHRLEGREVVIRRAHHAAELIGAQIVFISGSTAGNGLKLLPGLATKSILTVGETRGFLEAGGVIEFASPGFKINEAAARRARLELSPRLLQLASPAER